MKFKLIYSILVIISITFVIFLPLSSTKNPKPIRYNKLPMCLNLLWNTPKPQPIPPYDDIQMRAKYLKQGKGKEKDYYGYHKSKELYFKKLNEYNIDAAKVKENPKQALVVELGKTDGHLPKKCKNINGYRYLTDLRVPIDCVLKTDLKTEIPSKYDNFLDVVKTVIKNINKEMRDSPNEGVLEGKKILYIPLPTMSDVYQPGVYLKNNSFLIASTNSCYPTKTQSDYGGADLVIQIFTTLPVQGYKVKDCSRFPWKQEHILKRKQCFKVRKVTKDVEKKICDGDKKVKQNYIQLDHVKCDEKQTYIDFM